MASIKLPDIHRDNLIDTLSAIHVRKRSQTKNGCSAHHGTGLLALLADTLHHLSGDSQWKTTARDHLIAGVKSLPTEQLSTSFYRSAPGFAWAVRKLWQSVQYSEGEDVIASIATTYDELLSTKPKMGFDVINGLAGLTIFARAAPPALRQAIMDHLWQNLLQMAPGTPGFSWLAEGGNDNGANLGMAHGSPGVIAALAAALIDGWECPDAKAAVIRGGDWLRQQRIMVDGQFGFPYSVGESIPARLGWCYGMPSSATCFAWLAKLDQQFIPDVIDCGQDADAIRASEFHGITDACICHGEAGWAYIGARLVESLGQAVPPGFTFLTAQASFNLIAARTKDKESGTILHHVNAGTQVMDTVLEGAAGVWLAIAGLQDARCRKWEGMMLLDFPVIDGHEQKDSHA